MELSTIISKEHVLPFILAGKAQFVLWNSATDNKFTFDVWKSKTVNTLWNVYHGNARIGTIWLATNKEVVFTKNRDIPLASVFAQTSFVWYLNKLLRSPELIPDNVKVYHKGVCGVCRKPLTTPSSIFLGIGPVCLSKL